MWSDTGIVPIVLAGKILRKSVYRGRGIGQKQAFCQEELLGSERAQSTQAVSIQDLSLKGQ